MPALPAVAPIPVISSTQKGVMLRDILQVAERDYLYVLRGIATQEIQQQEKLHNPPTAMLIDGRRGRQVADATRSVRAWFADRKSMARAINDCLLAIISRGRNVTGVTLQSAKFYYSTGKGGALMQAGSITEVVMSAANPAALDLYVTLPRGNVRKWQWLSPSGSRAMRQTRNKKLLKYARARGQKAMQVSASVFDAAAREVQTKFKALDVKFVYLKFPNLNPRGKVAVDRIPAVKVRMAVRGRGRVN